MSRNFETLKALAQSPTSLLVFASVVMTVLVLPLIAGEMAGEPSSEEIVLDGAIRGEVVERIADALVDGYIYAEVGERLAEDLRGRFGAGEYDELVSPRTFAERLTHDLYEIADDLHLRIRARPAPAPESADAHRAPERKLHGGDLHHGFVRVEILEGNVGYIDLRGFAGDEAAGAGADAAMTLLSDVDALILDLGKNGGGGPFMVRYLSAYLFDEPVHLASTFMRGMPEPRERWTWEEVGGERLADVPVYVLTSKRTFSAAESFTFGLRNNDRITIVGERTGGGGHFGRTLDLGHGFSMFLPQGKTYNPKTGRGWEAEGIAPDIEVPYGEALETARDEVSRALGRAG